MRPAAYLAQTRYKPAALPLSYWGQGGHAGGTRTRMTRVATSDLTDSDTAWVGGPAGIRTPIGGFGDRHPAIGRLTRKVCWLGALDLNQVPKIQSLVSCRLDERRKGGTAGAIRTPVLDRRRVALCSSELQPYWGYAETGVKPPASAFAWLPETVSNRRHPPCKRGALPAELPGSGRGGRNRTDNGGVMSPARGHLPLNNLVRAAVIETAASTMATSRSAD